MNDGMFQYNTQPDDITMQNVCLQSCG